MLQGRRIDISHWSFIASESRGASAKFWVSDGADAATNWLFKPATVHRNGDRQWGDFSEVVASLVTAELGIPAATAQLVFHDGLDGVAVRNLRPPTHEMHSGANAMIDAGIDVDYERARVKQAAVNHTLQNIKLALAGYAAPVGFPDWTDCTAFDVFVGYLFLDALIANTDRHESNWAILRSRSDPGDDQISPAYDMENSLGFQLPESRIAALLHEKSGIERFAQRGFAKRFQCHADKSLIDLAAAAWALSTEPGKRKLTSLLDRIAACDFQATVGMVEGLSVVRSSFMAALLQVNGRRLINAIDS